MAEVWRQAREVTVRDVMDGINERAPRHRAYTTFMTIMGRLASKGLLHRRRGGRADYYVCLLYTSPSPRDRTRSRMPSSA